MVTETASTGQTVILVQPANPQVVYVPVYNTQVVYVEQAPPPSPNATAAAMVGFTAGIIIGSSSNNYYYGPYAGAALVRRTTRHMSGGKTSGTIARTTREDRRDNVQDNQGQRQQTAQNNQSERQATGQANQSSPVDRADEPVDTTDHSQHRERWRRRVGAGEPGQPAVHRAGKRVQPAVHRQERRWLPEWRKRTEPECEGKREPGWRRR